MNSNHGTYRRLFGYLSPYKPQVFIAYISMMGAALLNLFIPQIIKTAIDEGVTSGEATGLFYAAGLILLIAVIRGVAAFGQRFFGEWLSHRVAYDIRNSFFQSVQTLSFSFHDKAQTGDLMSRATSDITETERFTGIGLMDLAAVLILLVGVVVALFLENAQLALYVLAPLAVLIVATMQFGTRIRPRFKQIQEQMGVLSAAMQESMTGIGVVKAFARESYEIEKFEAENEGWFKQRYKAIQMWSNYWPLFSFIVAIAVLLLLWFGGPMALRGDITVGSLFAVISYVLMLNGPVLRLGFLVSLAATAGASATRVFEIIDTANDIIEPESAKVLESPRGDVTFESVSFAYKKGEPILQDINFSAKAGQVIALIGPTGSGKSSIINLLPRFYDPIAGRVLIDGMDIRTLNLQSLRKSIGLVLQEPFLFSSTIAENIAYGRPEADLAEIEEAAKAACAHNFIVDFPEGYATNVGERGVTLSGGQKQRIAIARALLMDPSILILDDSTSAVDTETEHLIQQALDVLMQKRTTFIIAQRLLSLKEADTILVLDEGRIAERGTHDELLALDGLYREIYDLQLKDQEELQGNVVISDG